VSCFTFSRIAYICWSGTRPMSRMIPASVNASRQEHTATERLRRPVVDWPAGWYGNSTQSSGTGWGKVVETATPTKGTPSRISSVAVTMTKGRGFRL
jgi:hypothetical protein